jgi:hypothetical protein
MIEGGCFLEQAHHELPTWYEQSQHEHGMRHLSSHPSHQPLNNTNMKAGVRFSFKQKSLLRTMIHLSQEQAIESSKRSSGKGEALTGVDGTHEVLDLALLAEDERGRPSVRRARGGEVGVEGDPGGVVAAVLEAAKAVEEHLEDVAPLPRHIVVEVGEDPAHLGAGTSPTFFPDTGGSSSGVLAERRNGPQVPNNGGLPSSSVRWEWAGRANNRPTAQSCGRILYLYPFHV